MIDYIWLGTCLTPPSATELATLQRNKPESITYWALKLIRHYPRTRSHASHHPFEKKNEHFQGDDAPEGVIVAEDCDNPAHYNVRERGKPRGYKCFERLRGRGTSRMFFGSKRELYSSDAISKPHLVPRWCPSPGTTDTEDETDVNSGDSGL